MTKFTENQKVLCLGCGKILRAGDEDVIRAYLGDFIDVKFVCKKCFRKKYKSKEKNIRLEERQKIICFRCNKVTDKEDDDYGYRLGILYCIRKECLNPNKGYHQDVEDIL